MSTAEKIERAVEMACAGVNMAMGRAFGLIVEDFGVTIIDGSVPLETDGTTGAALREAIRNAVRAWYGKNSTLLAHADKHLGHADTCAKRAGHTCSCEFRGAAF